MKRTLIILTAILLATLTATAQEVLQMSADGENIGRLLNEYLQDRESKAKKDTVDMAMWRFVETYKESYKEESANIFCLLVELGDETFDVARADSLLSFFTDFQDNEDIAAVRERLSGMRQLRIGAKVSELTMQTPDGKPVRLTDFVGRGCLVLVDFWASWCAPCCAEVPSLKAAYDRFHAQGFDIVSVSLDNKKDAWLSAIARLAMPWHHMSDLLGWQSEAVKAYALNVIPQTILFSHDGHIIATNLRGGGIIEAVDKALANRQQ